MTITSTPYCSVAIAGLATPNPQFDHFIAEMHLDNSGTKLADALHIKGVWTPANKDYEQTSVEFFRGALVGTTYYFRVAVADKQGNLSPYTSFVAFTPGSATAPNPTYTPVVTESLGGIHVNVGPSSMTNVEFFEGYWNLTDTAPATTQQPNLPPSNDGTSWAINLTVGQTAYIWARAVDANGNRQAWTQLGGSGAGFTYTYTSSPLNKNGNLPASALSNAFLTIKLGSTSGSSVVLQWGGSTAILMDGSSSVLGIGSYSPPSAPTLSQHSGGSRGATTLFVRIALVRDNMIMAVGPEASIAVSANNQITVTSPSSVTGMDGWIPLISAATLSESVPTDRANGIGLNVIAFGTNYSEPSGGWTPAGQSCNNWAVALSSASSTSVTPTNCLLAASTTYFFYPSFDIPNQMMCFPAATGNTPGMATAKNPFLAVAQCGDQKIALSTGAVSFTTPAANGTSSTTGGGGGGGGRALQ